MTAIDISKVDCNEVWESKIHWIKLFRQLTGAGLANSKFTFDLLEARGYNLNEVQSVVDAAGWYRVWYSILGYNDRLYRFCLDDALELVGKESARTTVVFWMVGADLGIGE